MAALITGIILSGLLLLAVVVLKVYAHVPAKELKRRARAGDELARILYGPAAYGQSLDLMMWLVIVLSGAILMTLLARNLNPLLAAALVAGTIWFIFAWLPQTRITKYSLKVTKFVSPVLRWLLERLHPVLLRAAKFIERHKALSFHTGLYTKEDILELIDKQKIQADNRVAKEELAIVASALKFGDKIVADVMTPKRMIKSVSSTDVIGPVLMGELHDSGHSRFPVYENKEDNLVGTLYLRDLVEAKHGGFVKSIMRREVFYVNDQQSIARVLDAFIKTKHHLFVAVNNFQEVVGVVSIEDVVEQVLGKQIIDEFDRYDNLRAVAEMEAEKDRQNQTEVIQSDEQNSKEDTGENTK